MEKTVFDGSAFVSIDLNSGRISTPGRDRLALVSSDILALIPAGEALNRAANLWGETHGKQLMARVEKRAAGIDALSSHLGGTLAAFGLGKLSVELRHNALFFRAVSGLHDNATDANAAILGGFLSGYLSAVSDQPFAVLDLGLIDGDRLFWAGNPDAVSAARRSIEKGTAPLDAVDVLMAGEASC